jgi:hypothetical protein
MHFKAHLIVVALIMVIMVFAWQWWLRPAPPQVITQQQVEDSEHYIRIIHASYGLNCRILQNTQTDPNYSIDSGLASRYREDNVLSIISAMCNGKKQCSVQLDNDGFGRFDPLPECKAKIMEVEYRCFTLDRPWRRQAAQNGTLNIDCSKSS